MTRQRNHSGDPVQLKHSRVLDWAARTTTRLSHGMETESDQQSLLNLAFEMKETADASIVRPGHTLHVAIEEHYIALKVKCHEQDGAYCRRACTKGCEEECYDAWHIGPTGYCLAVEWINAESANECYSGERRPIRDGMSIEVDWTGYAWTWSIPKSADSEQVALASPVGTVLQ